MPIGILLWVLSSYALHAAFGWAKCERKRVTIVGFGVILQKSVKLFCSLG